jgi:hypothetical protein
MLGRSRYADRLRPDFFGTLFGNLPATRIEPLRQNRNRAARQRRLKAWLPMTLSDLR